MLEQDTNPNLTAKQIWLWDEVKTWHRSRSSSSSRSSTLLTFYVLISNAVCEYSRYLLSNQVKYAITIIRQNFPGRMGKKNVKKYDSCLDIGSDCSSPKQFSPSYFLMDITSISPCDLQEPVLSEGKRFGPCDLLTKHRPGVNNSGSLILFTFPRDTQPYYILTFYCALIAFN